MGGGTAAVVLCVAAVVAAGCAAASARPPREKIVFDYGWRFKLGDPASAAPPLSVASNDSSFGINVTGLWCSQLAYTALGRMGVLSGKSPAHRALK